VITFDNAGVGKTSPLVGRLTISGMANQTDALIHALRLGRTDVLGVSTGGMIAQALAVLHPGDVGKLILCATDPGNGAAVSGSPSAAAALLHPEDETGMDRLLFPTDQQATQIPRFTAQLAAYPKTPPATASVDRQQLLASLAWTRGLDPAGRLIERVAAPTLIADGEDDVLAPPVNSRLLHREIRGSRLVLYPDAGHGFLFQDSRAFTAMVDSFLRR
jgi:pimeloyl-ACP methyl ester carboxylesterase